MRRACSILVLASSATLFWIIAPSAAHAYIDPGSSGFLLQLLIGAIAAVGMTVAAFWRQVRGLLSRIFGGSRRGAGDGDEPGTPPSG